MSNFFNRNGNKTRATVAAFVVLFGASACSAVADTSGTGSVDTPRQGCIPSTQTFTLSEGDKLSVAVADMSHNNSAQDDLLVEARGVTPEKVTEVSFSDGGESGNGLMIKRIAGEDDKGLPYWEPVNGEHIVDTEAIGSNPYGFEAREANRAAQVAVAHVAADGTVEVVLRQDCEVLPSVS